MAAELVPASRWQALRRAEAAARHGGLARERRDPKAATGTVRWLGRDMPQVPAWDADQALRLGYMANVVAFRCIQVLAETCSSFPIRVGPAKPERPGERADHNPNAPLARLLGPPPGGPNVETSARNLIRWTVVQRLCTGRNAWEIEEAEGGGGRPVALWPLPAPLLRAVPADGGSRYWSRFEYGRPDRRVNLSRDQVVYGWTPSGEDWREPQADLAAARFPLTIATMGDRYQYAFLRNGGVPAAIVTTEEFPDDDTRAAFRGQWSDSYGGPENAGKVAFNEVGEGEGAVADAIHVEVLGLAQRDAQYLEMHKHQLMLVAVGLGVPWSKLDASGRTFDNASEEDRTFLLNRVVPLLADLEDEINMQLAPRLGGEVCWFDLSGVEALRVTPRWTPAAGALLVRDGVISRNEQRAEMGLGPVDGGDEVVGGAGVPEEEPGDGSTEPAATEPTEPGQGARSREVVGVGPDRPAVRPSPQPDAGVRRRAGGQSDLTESRAKDRSEARRLLWAATEPMLDGLERSWERAFRSLFARQSKAVKGRLDGSARAKKITRAAQERRALTAQEISDLFDPAFWAVETREVAEGLYEVVVATSVGRIAGTVEGVAFDLSAPWVQDFIQARSNQLAGQVTETTYAAIQQALAEGVGAGESVPDLARRVGHVFDVARGSRATTIARTEVISAYNGAAVAGASSLPSDVVGGQEWIATGDAKTRPEHMDADGQVVAVGEPFNVGGESLAYPGDPSGSAGNTVQCRCTVGFLTPAEMAGAMGLPPAPRVTLGAARAALRLVTPTTFDEGRFRAALMEAA